MTTEPREFTAAHAVDVVGKAVDAAIVDIEKRISYLEVALVDTNKQMARTLAGLLRDLEPPTPAPAAKPDNPGEEATGTIVEEPEKALTEAKRAEAKKPTLEGGSKVSDSEEPPRRRRHRFL